MHIDSESQFVNGCNDRLNRRVISLLPDKYEGRFENPNEWVLKSAGA